MTRAQQPGVIRKDLMTVYNASGQSVDIQNTNSQEEIDPNTMMVVGGLLVVASLAMYGLVGYAGYKVASAGAPKNRRIMYGTGGAVAGVGGLILLTSFF